MSLENLKSVVKTHPIVDHAFLATFRAGHLNFKQVKRWAEQQFYFSISLPSAFAALYAKIPDRFWREKRKLVELLGVEAWGSSDARCHSKQFLEFGNFLGLNVDALTTVGPAPYTQAYISARLALCLDPDIPVAHGLAGIALGNEFLNLFIFRAYCDGIGKVNGLENCPVGYLEAHLNDEDADFNVFSELFRLVAIPSEEAGARFALAQLLNRRCLFFDELHEDIKDIR